MSALRSRNEDEARRRFARALETGLRRLELPFVVAHVEVHALGETVACYAMLEVPLEASGTPRSPEDVAAFWLDALADLSVDRGAFPAPGTPRRPASLSPASTTAAARLYRALALGLRERGLPFEALTSAWREDGSAYGVVDVAFSYSGPRQASEDLASAWLAALWAACGGGK